jgi:hypothetical protein
MAFQDCFGIPAIVIQRVRYFSGFEFEDVDLLRAIQPAIAPIIPIINIVEAAIAVFEIVKSIPSAITSLNPFSVIEAILDAIEKLAPILALLPWLSLPFMVVDVIDAFISTLNNLKSVIVRLQNEIGQIEAARVLASNLPNAQDLLDLLICAEDNVYIELNNNISALQALGKLLNIIGYMASLLGVDPPPSFDEINEVALEDLVDEIDRIIDALEYFRSLIPLP